jgi:hypothetical protein
MAKYGITDDDLYNFDETGFMMGVITASIVVTYMQVCFYLSCGYSMLPLLFSLFYCETYSGH